jgi:hypothetical protein
MEPKTILAIGTICLVLLWIWIERMWLGGVIKRVFKPKGGPVVIDRNNFINEGRSGKTAANLRKSLERRQVAEKERGYENS